MTAPHLVAEESLRQRGNGDGDLQRRTYRWTWLLWALSALAVIGELARAPNHDAAWFAYLAERVLKGDRLYVDLIEANPPLVVWVNLPVVLLGQLLHLSPVTVLRILVVVGATISALLTGAIAQRSCPPPASGHIVAALTATLLSIGPGMEFGQREHLATIAMLPYVALTAVTIGGGTCGRPLRLAIGLVAGIGMAIKPPLFLAWAALTLLTRFAPHRKSRVVAPEHLAALTVGGLYVAAVGVLAPDYRGSVAFLGPDYYRYGHRSVLFLLFGGSIAFPLILAAGTAWILLRRDAPGRALSAAFLVAAIAAFIGVLLQHKGWHYHYIPAVVFGALALGSLACLRPVRLDSPPRRCGLAAITIGFWLGLALGAGGDLWAKVHAAFSPPTDEARARKIISGYPSATQIQVLSSQVYDAFPLVNETGLRLVGGLPSQWQVQLYHGWTTRGQPQGPLYPSLADMAPLERVMYVRTAQALVTERPDFLLIERPNAVRRRAGTPTDFDFLAYLGRDSAAALALADYRRLATLDSVTIYRRADGQTLGKGRQ